MKLRFIDVQHLANPHPDPSRRRVRIVLEGEVSEAERQALVGTFQNGREVVDIIEAMK